MNTTQKVAVITGASQGIGAGLVSAYNDLGFAVVANSRSISTTGHEGLVTVAGDIGEPEVAERIVKVAVEHFGRVDTLVNNAGIFVAKPFAEYTRDDFEQVLSTNVSGFFHITQAVVRQLLEQGNGGHIVNVTTTLVENALSVFPSALASLSKGGVAAATTSLAVELAAAGIRVNAVSPGVIRTPMHPEETHEFLRSIHPLNAIGDVEDIARGVIYLEQSPFVTGEFLHVDGGQSAGH